jgi:hypothetical protein
LRCSGSAAAYALNGTTSPANKAPAVGEVTPQGGGQEAIEEAFRVFDGSVNLWTSFVLRHLGDLAKSRIAQRVRCATAQSSVSVQMPNNDAALTRNGFIMAASASRR